MVLTVLAALGLGPALSLAALPLAAQGVTGAAIEGRVVTVDSTPLELAIVHVVNTSTGERWQTTTSSRGRYFLEHLSVGGPYRLEVRAVGYTPARRVFSRLALGQRLTAHFTLTPAVVQLPEITVTGTEDPRFSASRTGPALIISDSLIARLPSIGRDYTDLALLSPQVSRSPNGGLSFAGQHPRYNSFQIDGINNNHLFGSADAGNGNMGFTPGLTSLAPEAVEELQVEIAPFDVRYGDFAGGLVNAVTKSGTNRVEGSILGYLESSDLVGGDETGSRGGEFSRKELGLTFGTPIVQDRVALFLNAGMQRHVSPQAVPAPSGDTTGGADSVGVGIRYQSMVRFRDLLQGYGADAGSFSAGTARTPTHNLFVKVTAQLGVNSRLEVSHTYAHAESQDGTIGRGHGYYPFSSAGAVGPETTNATRLAWTTAFGRRFTNELILARVDDRRTCTPNSDFPRVSVGADSGELIAGMAEGCSGAETGQRVWELTDNFGLAAGDHRLTVGIHGELIDLVDDVVGLPGGLWSFGNLDSLALGEPNGYVRDLPVAGSQLAFQVNQMDAYLQDQWLPSPRLTLTAGLRLDLPLVPTAPAQHDTALRTLGINSALTPSGNALLSPRLGVNYDLSGRGRSVLRGGVGFFTGHPAYVWFRTVYRTAEARAFRIECVDNEVPEFTLDPRNQPTACAEPTPISFPLNYFDPEFRYPRNLKVDLGADHLLPGGIVATLDVLYSLGVNTVQMVDVNLRGPVGVSAGEGGRVLYGTFAPNGRGIPSRRDSTMRFVAELGNASGPRSYSISAQLSKRFPNGTELSGAYTYTDARDRVTMGYDLGGPNLGSTPVDGSLEHREIRTSFWARPHKVTLVATSDLPLGFQLGFTYSGMSGEAYTYVSQGDPNADGFSLPGIVSNDVVYVPKDAGDITLADSAAFPALDRLIRSQPCLRSQRGRLMKRNSCRDPWVHETSARMSKRFRLSDRRSFEVTADLFNVLSFLDSDWGRARQTPHLGSGNVELINLVGYDAHNARGVYELLSPSVREVDVEASRWRLQLGATVSF